MDKVFHFLTQDVGNFPSWLLSSQKTLIFKFTVTNEPVIINWGHRVQQMKMPYLSLSPCVCQMPRTSSSPVRALPAPALARNPKTKAKRYLYFISRPIDQRLYFLHPPRHLLKRPVIIRPDRPHPPVPPQKIQPVIPPEIMVMLVM